MNSIRIATRGSKLAITQSKYVSALLRDLCPDVEITLVQITNRGRPIYMISFFHIDS